MGALAASTAGIMQAMAPWVALGLGVASCASGVKQRDADLRGIPQLAVGVALLFFGGIIAGVILPGIALQG